jgi:hypothetical protein
MEASRLPHRYLQQCGKHETWQGLWGPRSFHRLSASETVLRGQHTATSATPYCCCFRQAADATRVTVESTADYLLVAFVACDFNYAIVLPASARASVVGRVGWRFCNQRTFRAICHHPYVAQYWRNENQERIVKQKTCNSRATGAACYANLASGS